MTTSEIINFDSPWEQIVEAARTPLSGTSAEGRLPATAQCDLLSEGEVSFLAGMPVCLLNADGAPPVLPDPAADNPERGEFFRQQALRKGWKYAELSYWPRVGAYRNSSVQVYFLPHSQPGDPSLRQGPEYGSEFDLTKPLAHRLSGDSVNVLGVITLSPVSERVGFPAETGNHPADELLITQLHEMFHLVQLRDAAPKSRLLQSVLRERDAEHAAVTAFQTCCNGSPVVAARRILGRTAAVMTNAPKYFFWPGMSEIDFRGGVILANSVRLQGVLEQFGQPMPDYDTTVLWALHFAEELPQALYVRNQPVLDSITTVVSNQYTDAARPFEVFKGLASACERGAPDLTSKGQALARKIIQSVEILCPSILK